MPSRKFSLNSQFSTSSQKTSGSSSNEVMFCRRAASVHQINELYAALNELIHSPPLERRRNTAGSSASIRSEWSSEGNLLYDGAKLPPRANSEGSRLRPARSTSCLSSKSCYASINSKNTSAGALIAAKKLESSKSGGIYSKIVAKFRAKKSGEKSKIRKHSTGKMQERVKAAEKPTVQSIDDLLVMASFETNASGKASAKEKRKNGRTKANSFDSSEPASTNICVHNVSSKLKTWYTRAASYAATIEDGERSRAESSCTGSTDNLLESSGYESKGDVTNVDNTATDELARDFDASSPEVLAEPEPLATVKRAKKKETYPMKTLERKLSSDLKPFKSWLKRSYSSYEPSDDVFEKKEVAASNILSKTLWKSENKCDLIRRLSLTVIEDVLTGKSASCDQISSYRLNRDLSKRKVQQWLKDLGNGNLGKDESQKCEEKSDADDSNDIYDSRKVNEESDVIKEDEITRLGISPHDQPLFYIPNIGKTQRASVKVILDF